MLRMLTLAASIAARRAGIDDEALAWLTGALSLTLPLVSLGFLAGLLAWRLYTADALLVLAHRLRIAPDAEARHAAMALAVKDPTLDLAYARPGGRGWVTAAGWPVALPGPESDRSVTFITDDKGPVAALIHDATLREQRAFIEAVGAYALVWDENERLAERVDSSRGELRASRARILAAADDERRRIERDLHDGGQQRLVALRIRLQLAEDMMARSPAGARELLQRLAHDVDGVLEELRSLAAGVFPATLAAHGLPDAVRAASLQSPVPVNVVIKGAARYPEDVETAAYFCVLEALQNVAKHAPEATAAQVLLELEGDLVFEVRDDGPGFDMKESSSRGLLNMRDRVSGARRRARDRLSPRASAPASAVACPPPPAYVRHSRRRVARPSSCLRMSTAAPDVSTARASTGSTSIVTSTTTTSGRRSAIRRAVSKPSMSGMWTSSSTSAGIEPLDLGHRRRPRVRGPDPAEPRRRRHHLARDVEEDRLVVDPEHPDLVRRGRAHPRI